MRIPVVCKLHGHPYHGVCQKVPAYFCMPPRALGHQHTGPIRPYGSPDVIYSRSVQYKVSVTKIEADDTMAIVKSNRAVISSIADYLSLPGYKRFFKGMEVPTNEAAQ